MRRRFVVGGLAVAVVGAAVGAVVVAGSSDRAASASWQSGSTAEVVRTDLVSRTDVDGTLGYAHTYTIAADTSGRITWLPAVGDTIHRGGRVYDVDGHSVPLFHGSIPLWRPLSDGVAEGDDVRELETNLKALGYGDGIEVDNSFTWVTALAVTKWQAKLGVAQTGTVAPGDLVVALGDLLVSTVKAELGGAAHGPVLTATDMTRQITVNLPVTKQELAVVGGAVRIKLPGGKTTTGKISSVGTTATAGTGTEGGRAQTGQGTETATVPVYVSLDDPTAAGRLDGAPVTVGFTSATRKAVLAVPVNALRANADGSYAVEVVNGGRRSVVPVQLGAFADGLVEVSGTGLEAGMRVEVPRS